MKRNSFLTAALFALIALTNMNMSCPGGGNSNKPLSLEKSEYAPGEYVIVRFNAPLSFPMTAWVGIVPTDVPHGREETNDLHDIDFQYIERRTSGAMTFRAPIEPGKYDFRMNNSDDNGVEVASVTFRVEAPD